MEEVQQKFWLVTSTSFAKLRFWFWYTKPWSLETADVLIRLLGRLPSPTTIFITSRSRPRNAGAFNLLCSFTVDFTSSPGSGVWAQRCVWIPIHWRLNWLTNGVSSQVLFYGIENGLKSSVQLITNLLMLPVDEVGHKNLVSTLISVIIRLDNPWAKSSVRIIRLNFMDFAWRWHWEKKLYCCKLRAYFSSALLMLGWLVLCSSISLYKQLTAV